MYDGKFLVVATFISCLIAHTVFLVLSFLIPLVQKWWGYATMAEKGDCWGTKILLKMSFHKIEVKQCGTPYNPYTEENIVGIFGTDVNKGDLWIYCLLATSLTPAIIFLGLYFWEVSLILGVLALLTKLSRMVITVKRKLDKHMVDPKAHQDK